MIKNENVRTVVEDAVVGNQCTKYEKTYCSGYDDFQYPFTVSFRDAGIYTVSIKGKKAVVEKIE